MSQGRNVYIDYLKGLLIFLVVYGHTIQYVAYRNNEAAFFDNPIFKLIYMFHMPLFMAISGFVSFHAIARSSAQETINKRFQQLIIPIVSWAIISRSFLYFSQIDLRHSKNLDLLLFLPKSIIYATLESFWFLWCVFGATIIVLILRKLNLDRILGFTLVSLAILFLPEHGNLYFFKYTFPFFCVGYLLSKNSNLYNHIKIDFLKLALGVALSFVCFLLWHKETYIYISKMNFTNGNDVNIILRYFSGFILSLTFFMLSFSFFYSKCKHPFLCELGKNSLAIYILQTYVFFMIERTNVGFEIPILTMLCLSPFIAGFICITAHYFATFLYQYPLPSKLILGGFTKAKS